jgi:hypothetical protein
VRFRERLAEMEERVDRERLAQAIASVHDDGR